jgi:hypothetical protein
MAHRRIAATVLLIVCLLVNSDVSSTAPGSAEFAIFLPWVRQNNGTITGSITLRGEPVSGQPVTLTLNDYSGSVDLVTYSGPDGRYIFQPSPAMALAERHHVSWEQNGAERALLLAWICSEVTGPPGSQPLCSFDIAGVPPLSPLNCEPLDLPVTFTWQARGLPGESYSMVFTDVDYGKEFNLQMDLTSAGSYTLTTLPEELFQQRCYRWGITVHGPNGSGKAVEDGRVMFR